MAISRFYQGKSLFRIAPRRYDLRRMVSLAGQLLKLRDLAAIASGSRVRLAPHAHQLMEASRRVVERVATEHRAVYGINTGFGKLCDVKISNGDIDRLQ